MEWQKNHKGKIQNGALIREIFQWKNLKSKASKKNLKKAKKKVIIRIKY